MAQWGNKDDKSSTGTVTLTAPTVTFNGATAHAAGVYTSASHPFQTGDEVVYNNGGGTSVVGLTSGSTYYVTETTANTFMVAATEAQARHNVPTPIVSTDGVGASHTFIRALALGRGTIAGSSTLFTTEASTGDVIQVGSQEMQIIAIASDTACTVKNNNQAALTVFSGQQYTLNEKPTSKLGGTYSSMNIVGIDGSEIAAGGDNVVSIAVSDGGTLYVEAPAVTVAAPASLTIPLANVSIADDTITSTAHGLKTGTKLTYAKVGATAITGLVDATAYYVVADTDNTFKLASSLSNAQAGTTINITGTGSASQTFTGDTALATATISNGSVASIAVTNVGSAYVTTPTVTVQVPVLTVPTTNISTSTDVITYTAHGLSAGDTVKYYNGGGTSATGLTTATTYYVIASGLTANAFKVSATSGGSAIDITGTGNNAQYFQKMLGTGAVAAASRGTGPSAASKGWVNRVVMTGANSGRIQYETLVALSSAASMSDAADDLVAPDA